MVNNNDANRLYGIAVGEVEVDTRTIRVRVLGRSEEIPLSDIGIHEGSNDGEIKAAVSRHLDVPLENFQSTVVERLPEGNFILRPQAVFGI